MDSQHLIDIGLATACAVTGWFARELWAAVKELKSDLTRLSVELPKTYVTRDDYRSDLKEIRDLLGRIFDKLDGKVDRSYQGRDTHSHHLALELRRVGLRHHPQRHGSERLNAGPGVLQMRIIER